ncbi:MAG: hypothetical protein EOO40_05060 [Deltaproteobacteria bacterium]|nr:MAG: hypothetical protein EOO40_05060 [Deltaproteobacteria bacterium]
MAGSMHDAPLTVENVPLSKLTLDPHNARLHGQENLASIKGSLEVFGQREAIVVRRANNTVIGGNGRVEAMRDMGWTHCSVAYVDCTDAEATALGLALNRTAETATWNADQLDTLLAEVRDAGFSTDSFGFSEAQVDRLLNDIAEAKAETDAQEQAEADAAVEGGGDPDVDVTDIEPPADPITKVGDIWGMGEAFYCESCKTWELP